MINQFNTRIQQKTDTLANWQSANPVLRDGEIAIVRDGNSVNIKIGNGTDAFADLPYFASEGACIEFRSLSYTPITLIANGGKTWDGIIEYSTDMVNWTEWTDGGTINSSANGSIFLRGAGNTRITDNTPNSNWSVSPSNSAIGCFGNLSSLLNYKQVAAQIGPFYMAENAFAYLFKDMSALAVPPSLPAFVLRSGCYKSLFAGCINLTVAPQLPALYLEPECYRNMFSGCENLLLPPILPAKLIPDSAYAEMFRDCGLWEAPELPATVLGQYCYKDMFRGCTDLQEAPELPATELNIGCYYGMFQDCTSLIKAKSRYLPLGPELKRECYCQMFQGCTSLTTAPDFNVISSCDCGNEDLTEAFKYMYSNCSSLTMPPQNLGHLYIKSGSPSQSIFEGMFEGCTNLQPRSAPNNTTHQEYNEYAYEIPYISSNNNNFLNFFTNYNVSSGEKVWLDRIQGYRAPETPQLFDFTVSPEHFNGNTFFGLREYGYDPEQVDIDVWPHEDTWGKAGLVKTGVNSYNYNEPVFFVENPPALFDRTLQIKVSKVHTIQPVMVLM